MKSHFGSDTRAADGCIVTYRMRDGSIEVRHFASVVKTHNRHGRRRHVRDRHYTSLLIEWADEHDAKVISISSPETILRDLKGPRVAAEPKSNHRNVADVVHFPEKSMLKNRIDLLEKPSSCSIDDRSRAIKHVVVKGSGG